MPAIRSPRRSIAALALAAVALSAAGGAAHAETIWGYTNAGQNLVSFSSAAPNTILTTAQVTGMNAGDSLRGIDFRANGTLYGLGAQGRLYTINTATAVATQVGSGTFAVGLNGTSFGFDFADGVAGGADAVHITSDTARQWLINPDTGAVIDLDSGAPGVQTPPLLAYVAGDPRFGQTPAAVGLACVLTGSPGSTPGIDRFAIDFNSDTLLRFTTSTGAATTIGSMGVDAQIRSSLDYSALSGVMYASMFIPGSMGKTSLYSINLNTGAATIVGAIGPSGGLQIDGISAYIPEPGAATLILAAGVIPALGRNRKR